MLVQLVVVAVILACLEIILAIAGVPKLDNPHAKPPSTYPAQPSEYIKVAIFGGSAAAATYSPRGVHDLLAFELNERFPSKKIYVKNYASHGEPFHRHQAEYAKRLVSKYDFVLIYAGNNEAENWYDDSGYWRTPEYKEAKDLVFSPPSDAAKSPSFEKLRAWLSNRSRIFSMAARLGSRLQPPLAKNRNHDYSEFEDKPSVPKGELAAIVKNFVTDLREICELGRDNRTQVIVATTATFETWPPSYSTFDPSLTDEEKQKWQTHYATGLEYHLADNASEALKAFRSAAVIDDSVAILNYRMGMCHLQLGEHQSAREFLSKAIDADGHYFRPHTTLHDAARRLAEEIENLHFVDIVAALHKAREGGIDDAQLFTDICHPSFLGYVIIARAVLDELMTLDPFDEADDESTTMDWQELAKRRYQDLKVTPNEEKIAVAQNILYCFDLIHFSAYPERCIEQVNKLMTQLEDIGFDDPMVEAFNSVCRARIAIRNSDLARATNEVNIALLASPDDLDMILGLKAWNHYIEDEFIDAGIVYSKDSRQFELSRNDN